MKDLGKTIATVIIWGGTSFLSYLFHSFGFLTAEGAGWMFAGAILLTAALWRVDIF